MQKTRRNLIFRFTFLMVALALLTTNIVFAETFTPIKRASLFTKDTLPNSKSTSIIFGRVYVASRVVKFTSPGKSYLFEGIRNNDQKQISMKIDINSSDKWNDKTTGVWGYDTFYALGAEPGNYSFQNVTYNFENYYVNPALKTYLDKLILPFQEKQLVKARKLVYFGVIQITFVSFEVDAFHNFSFQHFIKITNDFDNDLKQFKKAYPNLYKQFQNNIVIADFAKK